MMFILGRKFSIWSLKAWDGDDRGGGSNLGCSHGGDAIVEKLHIPDQKIISII